MPRALVLATLAPLLFAGCSAIGLLDNATQPRDAYELHASADGPVARAQQDVYLTVEEPSASAAIDTDSILIRPAPTQVFYAPDARWIETAPLMVQSALVDGLDRTGAFRYVGRRPLASSGDYALVTSISAFRAELSEDEDTATIRIRITARLVRESDASVVAAQTFEGVAQATGTDTATIVNGFDQAGTKVLDDIIDWVLKTRGVRVAS